MPEPESFENLNASEQVAYLRDEKGVAFELVPESVAEWILSHESCFYRLKAYAKDFDKGMRIGSRSATPWRRSPSTSRASSRNSPPDTSL